MNGNWSGDDIPNRLPGEWKVICEFGIEVVDLEAAGDRLLVTLVDGSRWSVAEDGQKVMLSGSGRWIQ